MASIYNVIQYLDSIAPPQYQESYDNAGLIVGDPGTECKGVLIALDAIEEVLDEAIKSGFNLLVVHHPIVFGGLKKITGKNYVERVVVKAIKHDIAIYAAHTNLDNMLYHGVNEKITQRLGLKNVRILAPKKGVLKKLFTYAPVADAEKVRQALFEVGAGQIGKYSQCSFNTIGMGTFKGNNESKPFIGEPGITSYEAETKIEVIFPMHLESNILHALRESHPYEEVAYEIVLLENDNPEIGAGAIGELEHEMDAKDFLAFLKQKMNAKMVRHTKDLGRPIKKVAVCGGAGSFLLKNAIAQKADVFVSGDFKYHEFFDAESHLMIADIGHYESEQFTSEIFLALISQKFSTFAVRLSEVVTNPVNYC